MQSPFAYMTQALTGTAPVLVTGPILRDETILRVLRAGGTYAAAAREALCSDHRVAYLAKRHGLAKPKRAAVTPAQIEEALRHYMAGKTTTEAGAAAGISGMVVWRHAKARGVFRPTRHGFNAAAFLPVLERVVGAGGTMAAAAREFGIYPSQARDVVLSLRPALHAQSKANMGRLAGERLAGRRRQKKKEA